MSRELYEKARRIAREQLAEKKAAYDAWEKKEMETNLFEKVEFDAFRATPLKVDKKEVTVTYYHIEIDGLRFEAKDLLQTLEDAFDGGMYVTWGKKKEALLKKLGVVKTLGTSNGLMCAEKGPYFDEFYNLVKNALIAKGFKG